MVKSKYSIILATFLIIGVNFVALLENAKAGLMELPCILEIEKVAIPADDTPFDFIATGDINSETTLSDPSNPTFIGPIGIDQTVNITEELPPGWELESIECDEHENNCGDTPCLNITIDEESHSITAQCLDDDMRSCTFTNSFSPEPRNVPTISEWGLIALAGIIGIVGLMVIRRRKALA